MRARVPEALRVQPYDRMTVNGRVQLTHRVRAERALGKQLPPGAVVHHADGTTRDNGPLVICQDQVYHRLIHVRMRVVRAGGNPNTQRLCCVCKTPKLFAEFNKSKADKATGLAGQCRECQNAYDRAFARRHNDRIKELRGQLS